MFVWVLIYCWFCLIIYSFCNVSFIVGLSFILSKILFIMYTIFYILNYIYILHLFIKPYSTLTLCRLNNYFLETFFLCIFLLFISLITINSLSLIYFFEILNDSSFYYTSIISVKSSQWFWVYSFYYLF